jgi:hypothetical protein
MSRKVAATLTADHIARLDALASRRGLTREAALTGLVIPAGLLREEERAALAGLSLHDAPDGEGVSVQTIATRLAAAGASVEEDAKTVDDPPRSRWAGCVPLAIVGTVVVVGSLALLFMAERSAR